MTRLTIVGLLLGVAVSLPLAASAQKKTDGDRPHDAHTGPMMECAKACDECARTCEACGTHCAKLIADGKKEHLTTLGTCRDCATMCMAASAITARHGVMADLVCTGCADACKRCGAACAKIENDKMMRRCAEECRRCEKACREMLKHMAASAER